MKTRAILFLGIILLAACSKPDTSLLEDARHAEAENDFATATTLYQQIIDEFPDGKAAPEAMYRLAAIYQNHKNEPLKAATLYEKIHAKYPESQYAHRGLFIAGFTYANELMNETKARAAYEMYLEKYPDSAMAKEASFELQTLGRTPDEVLSAMRDTVKEVEHDTELMQPKKR